MRQLSSAGALTSAVVAACVVASPFPARADAGETSSMSRHVYLDDLVAASTASGVTSWFDYSRATNADNLHQLSTDVTPSLDFAAGSHLTLGGTVQFHADRNAVYAGSTLDAQTGSPAAYFTGVYGSTGVMVTPRVGWRFRLTEGLVLWPKLAVGLGALRQFDRGLCCDANAPADVRTAFYASLEGSLDLLAPLTGPLFLTIGPSLRASNFRHFGDANGVGIYAGIHAGVGLAF